MRYVGGKSKLATGIARAILENSEGRELYLEPFIGGGAVFAKVAPHFAQAKAGDIHPDLVQMWNAILFDGWEPPSQVSEERYATLRDSETSSPERGFVGFGGSFGGKWFAGYARGGKNADGTPRNHLGESRRAVMKIRSQLETANLERFQEISYDAWDVPSGAVLYCDPPYRDTMRYSTGGFDHEAFYGFVENETRRGVEVFVSEYSAPAHWNLIWEKEHRQSMVRGDQNRWLTSEKVFRVTYKQQANNDEK